MRTPGTAQEQPEHAPDCRQQRALEKQLPDDSTARRTQRRTHGDLPLPSGRAGEKQVGDVRTGDQEHESDGSHQHLQIPIHQHHAQLVDGIEARGPAAVGFGRSQRHRRGHLAQLGVHLFAGDSGDQPAKGEPIAARALPILRGKRAVGQPDVVLGHRKLELGRQNADHDVWLVVEHERPSDETRIGAEACAPGVVGEDGGLERPACIFPRRKPAADDRLHSQRGEKVGGDEAGAEAIRLAFSGEVGSLRPHQAEVADGAELAFPVLEIGHRHQLRAPCLVHAAKHHHTIRIRIRQRPQQHRVDDGEDRGVGSDSERERQENHGGEPALVGERAKGVTGIFDE